MIVLDVARTLLRRWWLLVAFAGVGAALSVGATRAPGLTAPWHAHAGEATQAAYGAVAGLAIALVGALTIRPRQLRTRGDIERAYARTVLAEIPRTAGSTRYEGYVAVAARPSGRAAEAYRRLRTSVLNLPSPHNRAGENAGRVVAVTSPDRGDGRSSVVTNLAAAIAESGRSVLIVDADFGHPTAHFGTSIHPGTGLSDLLATEDPGARLAEVIQYSDTPGVAVLSIGSRGGRLPGALATRLPRILAVATQLVDVVVIDAGPLLHAADASDPVDLADAVLVAARRGRTGHARAGTAAQTLTRCRAQVAGVVLIGVGRDGDTGTAYLAPSLGAAGPTTRMGAGLSSVAPMNPVALGHPVGVAG
ncbi:MAG: CpsD/CapB family tyrosine-protein kinase [Sporichthyaceae bacterium]